MSNLPAILPAYSQWLFARWQRAQEHRTNIEPWKAYIEEKLRNQSFRARLLKGPKVSIRPLPSHDLQTACEIFIDRIYECDLKPDTVRRVIDLGGNVGYSCLFWCETYPNASVLTFEPHPVHCRLLQWQVKKNRYARRVTLVAAAAGVRDGVANLSDEDDGSSLVLGTAADSIGVRVVDVFKALPDGPVDLLKIDIEGSEYEILEDPRFASLAARTRCVMLEWHLRGDRGEAWCRDRLSSLGFRVESGRTSCDQFGKLFCGMLYCFRN